MCFLCIIKGLEKRALIDRWTGVTDIRSMNPDSTDFFHEVRAVSITAANAAIGPVTVLSGTLFSAKSRRFDLTGKAIFTSVE